MHRQRLCNAQNYIYVSVHKMPAYCTGEYTLIRRFKSMHSIIDIVYKFDQLLPAQINLGGQIKLFKSNSMICMW
jgi:hypothetical protein